MKAIVAGEGFFEERPSYENGREENTAEPEPEHLMNNEELKHEENKTETV